MTLITADTLGALYILCFDRPIGNPANARAMAGHYLGFALNMHAAGHGAALTQAVVKAGIGWQAFWRPGTPAFERHLKAHCKNTPLLCPRCCAARRRMPRCGFQPLDQLALPFAFDDTFNFPAQPAGRMDWYEIAQLRRWRATAAALITPVDLTRLDDCL